MVSLKVVGMSCPAHPGRRAGPHLGLGGQGEPQGFCSAPRVVLQQKPLKHIHIYIYNSKHTDRMTNSCPEASNAWHLDKYNSELMGKAQL